MPLVHVGLGANLGERQATLRRALELLDSLPDIAVAAVSSLRETDPEGYLEQPRFLNGVAAVETSLAARTLLERLLAVELSLGRTREGPLFGPRTIDLDLLLYGVQTIDEPGLRVPHPRLHERLFVLEPLVELDPGLLVPGLGRVDELLARLH